MAHIEKVSLIYLSGLEVMQMDVEDLSESCIHNEIGS